MTEIQFLLKRANLSQNPGSSSPRRKKWTLVIIGLLFCLYFTYFLINPADPSVRVLDVPNKLLFSEYVHNQQSSSSVSFSSHQVSPLSSSSPLPSIPLPSTPPIILLWTGAFDSDSWWGATESPLNCDCIVSRNRSLLAQAKVVLFYWRNTNLKDLPKYKFEGQTWIWHHMESPMNTFRKANLAQFANYIDCWSSYLSDSDFPTPYGEVLKLSEISYANNSESWQQRKTINVPFSSKTRNVAWMVSNCKASSGRDEYAKELAKYIDVDIYGACGSLKCPSSKGSYCYHHIETNYRFYLSFENSICSDYYTEKIINILNYTVIPIVLGGANYSSILPNHSYIDALSFKSPRYLAMLLRNLAADEKRYSSYFEWKRQFTVKNHDYRQLFCQICSKLKSVAQSSPSSSFDKEGEKLRQSSVLCNRRHKDLVGWWFNEGSCKSWSVIRSKFLS